MVSLLTQIKELAPSAKEPLFRRLMVEESLAYLREKQGIIGFELDLQVDQSLSGFALIGIQKHTIYAYCSDLQESPKLILFPSLEKLFDPAFELLDLHVVKKVYTDSQFKGMKLSSGPLSKLVKDLTPPMKKVDIPESVADAMSKQMQSIETGGTVVQMGEEREEVPVKVTEQTPVVEEPVVEPMYEEPMEDQLNAGFVEDENPYDGFEENGYDAYGGYDDYDAYDSYDAYEEPLIEEPIEEEPVEDERSTILKSQDFDSLGAVSDFVYLKLGVSKPLATTVVNRALQSNVSPEYRIDLAKKLFCKLFDEKKI
jgi:hypothetical protein